MISTPHVRVFFLAIVNAVALANSLSRFFFKSLLSVISQTKWVVKAEKVNMPSHFQKKKILVTNILRPTGGKVKPLKAAKKEKKELDEDDLAHQAKLKAGTLIV